MVSHTPHLHMCTSHTRVHTTHTLHVPHIHMPHVEQTLVYTVCKNIHTCPTNHTCHIYTQHPHIHTPHMPHTTHRTLVPHIHMCVPHTNHSGHTKTCT